MRKIRDFKLKTLYLAIYAGIIGIGWLLKVPCFWQWLLHIACPGCGMTRACVAFLRGDFSAAFACHGMVWSLPLLLLLFLFDGQFFRRKWINIMTVSVLGIGFLINWIAKLIVIL